MFPVLFLAVLSQDYEYGDYSKEYTEARPIISDCKIKFLAFILTITVCWTPINLLHPLQELISGNCPADQENNSNFVPLVHILN